MSDMNPILIPPTDPIRSIVRDLNQHAARTGDLELGGIAGALSMIAADMDQAVARLAEQAQIARSERDSLDQTRPTDWAYRQATKAIEKHRARADNLAGRIDKMATCWEQELPEVIRTATAVSALRAAIEAAQ